MSRVNAARRLPTLGDRIEKGRDVAVHCRACRHFAVLRSAELARRLGDDVAVLDLPGGLVCSACGSRDVGVQRYDPGPRRRGQ